MDVGIRIGIIGGSFRTLYGYNQNLYEYKRIVSNINKLLIRLNALQSSVQAHSETEPTPQPLQYHINSLMFSNRDGIDYLTYKAYEKSRNLLAFPYEVVVPSTKQIIRDRTSYDLYNRLIKNANNIIKIYNNTANDYIYNQCDVLIIIDSLKAKSIYSKYLNDIPDGTKVFFIDSQQAVKGITKYINTIIKSLQH